MDTIRIGTRGSKLALWQAKYVEKKLQTVGFNTEIVIIETQGDKILDVSISKIGSKGVFTEEIEEQLAMGVIDIAVHSAKDMQSELPEGFELIAFSEREKVNDVLVSEQKNYRLENKPVTIGTSSTRRVALLKRLYPEVKTVPVRGNLQTRISKMKDGACDALMLAYAGMYRMGYSDLIVQELDLEQFTPAVGQGSIAIECAINLNDKKKKKIRGAVNHEETEIRILCERAFLKKLQGGCSIPVYGLASLRGNQINMKGGIVSLDGTELVEKELLGEANDNRLIGNQLAQKILEAGGREILEKIKNTMKLEDGS
ncbi:MAG: hydroxymethylbilane synthase [Bacteroidota bacterium]